MVPATIATTATVLERTAEATVISELVRCTYQ
jgi:hypothetical protein